VNYLQLIETAILAAKHDPLLLAQLAALVTGEKS
jgi:hypothetical protein